MRINNTTSPTFGTKLEIGDSAETTLAKQSSKVLDGIYLAGKTLEQNLVGDRLVLHIPQETDLKSSTDVSRKKLHIDYWLPDNSYLRFFPGAKSFREGPKITLKTLSKKSAMQVRDYLLKALEKLQPAPIKAKARPVVPESKMPSIQELKAELLIEKHGTDDFTCA